MKVSDRSRIFLHGRLQKDKIPLALQQLQLQRLQLPQRHQAVLDWVYYRRQRGLRFQEATIQQEHQKKR